jgi:hypothetical protein
MVPRIPLQPIDSNGRRGTELSPYLRGKILGQRALGVSLGQLSSTYGIAKSTIQYTVQQDASRTEGHTIPRPGRPSVLSESDKHLIFRLIKRDPFIAYNDIREQTGITASNDTLLRMVKASGYGHWRARKRPYLKADAIAQRLAWALERRDWTYEDWKRIIWTDECSVEIGKSKNHRWVFMLNHATEKWKKEHVITYSKTRRISIMIWGAIFGDDRAPLYEMNRDPETKRNGYSSQSYLETLEENLPQIAIRDRIFMQDNAPIHTAKIIKDWLWEMGISKMDWPPNSPDINPIEHAWAKLKRMIDRLDPNLDRFEGTNAQLIDHFLN